jgi:putative ABC transport system substrate-binding protein
VKQFWILDFGFSIGRSESKKVFCLALGAMLLALSFPVEAQQPKKVPRIGFLSALPSIEPAFLEGLRELGYLEGKNVFIERRFAEGRLDRIPDLVLDLVQLKVDVIILSPLVGLRAAKQATKSIPIVMVATVDPVATGLVDSLARPGGNITGVALLTRDLSAKRVELLKEVLPKMSRVVALWDADGPGPAIAFREYEAAAQASKLQMQSLAVRGPNPDLEGAFQAAKKGRAEALIVIINPLINHHQKRIVELATKNRLPSMHETTSWVEVGGLVSYAAEPVAMYRRAAYFVDKILKGTKPADLPVEQPTKFELVIDLKAAKQIGLTIPPNVLARADRVIRSQ